MAKYTLTKEQISVIECDYKKIRVIAYAGAAKTTTLVEFARHRPDKRILMLCYNASIAMENSTRFGSNTKVRTSHSFAREKLGEKFQDRVGELRFIDAKNILQTSYWNLVRDSVLTLQNFYNSADRRITIKNFKGRKDPLSQKAKDYNENVVASAGKLWHSQLDANATTPIDHDFYLKQYYLSPESARTLHDRYDYILIDEFQDTNAAFLDFIKKTGVPMVVVGDRYQQLYRFRGAVDAMNDDYFDDDESITLRLSKSFRFGGKIASVASAIILLQGETVPVEGSNDHNNVGYELPQRVKDAKVQISYLHRTNAGAIETALSKAEVGNKIFWCGGIEKYHIQKIKDVALLALNKIDDIKDKRLPREFQSFEDYKEYADDTGDHEARRSVKLVEKYKPKKLIEKLDILFKTATTDDMEAPIVVSTIHKAKGLEWPYVVLAEMVEFESLLEPKIDAEEHWKEIEDELNLLYVAVTRAQQGLVIDGNVAMVGNIVQKIKSGKTPLELPPVWLKRVKPIIDEAEKRIPENERPPAVAIS